MKLKVIILLLLSHLVVAVIGFAAGIFALPVITAPPAPSAVELKRVSDAAVYHGTFVPALKDSDFLHQAAGELAVGENQIAFSGNMSPGPDYILYLSPEFIETETHFKRLKPNLMAVGAVKSFNGFILDVPADVNIHDFNTVIIWCESFNQFISAAQYSD